MNNYYDSIAKGYDELHSSEQIKKLNTIYQAIKNEKILSDFINDNSNNTQKYTKILDVGCGSGIGARYFRDAAAFQIKEIFGIDPSKELIKIAVKNDPNGKYIVCGAEKIPFKDKEFDVVISITAIQNFKDIKQGLKEIKRVGKKYILTFLKKSEKKEEITKNIENNFHILKKIEEDKDIIYFCE